VAVKVLFYVDSGGATGGPGMHSVLIYRAFRRYFPNETGPLVFAADPEAEGIFRRALGDDVVALQTRTLEDPGGDPVVAREGFYRELCAVARTHGCDHVHILWGFVTPEQVALGDLPLTITLCDATGRGEDEDIDTMYFGSERWERYLRHALSVRCGYLAISEKTRRDALKKGVPEANIETHHLWVSPTLAEHRSDEVSDYVLYVGALADYKGVSHILDFARMYPEQPIEMCGYPSSDFPIDFTRYPSVRFHGYLPYDEVLAKMARARALLYLSYSEGFGLPMIEAQTLGTPLIVNPRNRMVDELLPRGSYVSVGNVASPSALRVAIDVAQRDRASLREAGLRNAAAFAESEKLSRLHEAIAGFHGARGISAP
jgi:glycosyltransferase involved in cell wall biosynthesis